MTRKMLREHARIIFRAGLDAVDPAAAVRRSVKWEGEELRVGEERVPLGQGGTVHVVGMGKASAAMGEALEGILGESIRGGTVVVKDGHGLPLRRIRVVEAGHPIPDERGEAGARAILEELDRAGASDLVFCLISGGGSALAPAPAPGITLEDKQTITELLLASGATIHEINSVRKHLSALKGGQLSRRAYPARVISLILSDVVGDDLDVIASGPTVGDPTTYRRALAVLESRNLVARTPTPVLSHLRAGAAGEIEETPEPGDPALERTRNRIVGNNRMALEAAQDKARGLGYNTFMPPNLQEGEARELARAHVALAGELRNAEDPPSFPACILTGGEATVTLSGNGTGGRNQEFALAAALEMRGMEKTVLLSAGTDGTDGPTDAAGALVDGTTVDRAEQAGLDPSAHLARNDSYHLFLPLGDLLVTGPTLTNVMDLRVLLLA